MNGYVVMHAESAEPSGMFTTLPKAIDAADTMLEKHGCRCYVRRTSSIDAPCRDWSHERNLVYDTRLAGEAEGSEDCESVAARALQSRRSSADSMACLC